MGQDITDSAGMDTVTTAADTGAADAGTPDTTTETQPTDEPVDEPDANTLSLPTPGVEQFVTSACGSLPISTVVQSNAVSAPTAMTTGQLVSGIIGSGSATNGVHYWSIVLEPGDYHVVLDSKSAGGSLTNLGTRLSELHANGGVTDLFFDNDEYDYRSRSHGYLNVAVARNVLLRLTPSFAAEDYLLGIVANGSPVPTPFFSDCPTINPLSVDTVDSLLLPEKGSSAGDRWYRVDLAAGMYTLNTGAVLVDDSSGKVHYKITLADQFGQVGRTVDLAAVDETGPVTSINSVDLNRDNAGPVWIRMRYVVQSRHPQKTHGLHHQ